MSLENAEIPESHPAHGKRRSQAARERQFQATRRAEIEKIATACKSGESISITPKVDGSVQVKVKPSPESSGAFGIEPPILEVPEVRHCAPITPEQVIGARKKYGSYPTNSLSVQEMKETLRSHPNWYNLPPAQRETLEMIVHKIGRILGGHNAPSSDSWLDIQGYVELIRNPEGG